jgi:hypothetical protein
MEKTLNQKIHEVPLDVKQAIYDRGYQEGCKETAENLFKRVFEEFNIFNDKEEILIYQVRDMLKYAAKQLGVKIKED